MALICTMPDGLVFEKVLHKTMNIYNIFAYLLTFIGKGCIMASKGPDKFGQK